MFEFNLSDFVDLSHFDEYKITFLTIKKKIDSLRDDQDMCY